MIPTLANTRIRDIDRREPVRLDANASLVVAVTELRERKRGAVLVEDDEGRLIGIFTERDLVSRLDHASHSWHDKTVSEYMTPRPFTVPASTPIAVVITRMGTGGFRHVPIVDREGRAQGLVSIRDILRHITEEFPQEFLNLPCDPEHAAHNQWGG